MGDFVFPSFVAWAGFQKLCSQTGVVSTWRFSKQLFSCAAVLFMQKLILVKTRERRGVEGVE